MTAQTGILLVAHGTRLSGGAAAGEAVLAATRARFPGLCCELAFCSCRELCHDVAEADDSLLAGLRGLAQCGASRVAVQSLHVARGRNFSSLAQRLTHLRERLGLSGVSLGQPLLSNPQDIADAAEAIFANLPKARRPDEAVLLMGHGSLESPNRSFASLAELVRGRDPLVRLGILQGLQEGQKAHSELGFMGISQSLRLSGAVKAWLLPLFCVAGEHARRDLAGDEPESWKSRLNAAGIACEARITGAAECPGFLEIWLRHLQAALGEFGA